MKVFGHRGAAAVAPENTLAGVRAALSAGGDGVECDVRLSADGVPVVIHDADLDRTTGGSGPVGSLPWDELRALDAGSGERIPSLEEVHRAAGGRVVVEIKSAWGSEDGGRIAVAVAELCRSAGPVIAVCSFDLIALGAFKGRGTGVPTGVLTTPAFDAAANVEAAVGGGHEICLFPDAVAGTGAIRAAHEAGRQVFVWTVNDPSRVVELEGAGVDAVITDDPAAALVALRR